MDVIGSDDDLVEQVNASQFGLGCSLFSKNASRAESVAKVSFREGMTHAEDWLFYYHLAYIAEVVYAPTQEPAIWYRVGHASASTHSLKLELGLK